jgi:hypothetical protein
VAVRSRPWSYVGQRSEVRDAAQDALGTDPGSLGHAPNRVDRALEEEEHDVVVGDPEASEIAGGAPRPRQLGDGAHDPIIEIAKVLLAHTGPEALRHPVGAARPGHSPKLGRVGRGTNQGFP